MNDRSEERGERRPTILVAEDFDDIRELMKLFLEKRGCQVLETTDGEQAVMLAHRLRPDLILMDIGLETLDGLSATVKIRQLAELSETPILIISAHVDCREAAYNAGCDRFLEKPVNFRQLSKAVDTMLKQHDLRRQTLLI